MSLEPIAILFDITFQISSLPYTLIQYFSFKFNITLIYMNLMYFVQSDKLDAFIDVKELNITTKERSEKPKEK